LIASPFAPLSYELTLNQLQRYYEKSYGPDIVPGAINNLGALRIDQKVFDGGGSVDLYQTAFQILYKTLKRAPPNTTIYNPVTGEDNAVNVFLANKSSDNSPSSTNATYSSYWLGSLSENSENNYFSSAFGASPVLSYVTGGSVSDFDGILFLHYTADARLGIV
jgi:hypothetical protein